MGIGLLQWILGIRRQMCRRMYFFSGSVCYGMAILPEDAHAKQRRPQD
jgi:hypothetical protein